MSYYSEPRYGYEYTIAKIGNTEFAFPSLDAGLASFQSSSGYDLVVNSILDQANVPNTISIYTKAGIHNLSTFGSGIWRPTGMSVHNYGDGIPSWPYPFTTATFATPGDGTQIRGPSSWLTSGGANYAVYNAVSGANAKGSVTWQNMAIMPPWGAVTSGNKIYGIFDHNAGIFIEDNLMFVPWGWSESGEVSPVGSASGNMQFAQSLNANGVGGGTEARIGRLVYIGLGQGGDFGGMDDLTIQRVVMYKVDFGFICNAIWHNEVHEIFAYDGNHLRVQFNGIRGNTLRKINVEQVDVAPAVSYMVFLASGMTTLGVQYARNWTTAKNSGVATVTNADTQLEFPAPAYNLNNNAVLKYVGGSPSFPVNNSGGTVMMLLETGTGGSGAVLKMWDPGTAAFRYAQISGGGWSITTSEPT